MDEGTWQGDEERFEEHCRRKNNNALRAEVATLREERDKFQARVNELSELRDDLQRTLENAIQRCEKHAARVAALEKVIQTITESDRKAVGDREFNAGVEATIQLCGRESVANPNRTTEEKAQYSMCLGLISEIMDLKRPVAEEK